jgi:hypothetical protein
MPAKFLVLAGGVEGGALVCWAEHGSAKIPRTKAAIKEQEFLRMGSSLNFRKWVVAKDWARGEDWKV